MECRSRLLPVEKTGMFSGLVADYLKDSPELNHLYSVKVSINGVRESIQQRQAFPTDRKRLHEVLSEWYNGVASPKQQSNIDSILSDHTFTICTAHQCNIFTGYLYFVFKILHVIRIAETLNKEFPEQNFVPVYYMGSEDNDLDELGQINIDGVTYTWNTNQKGAVGRMKVDKNLLQLITQMEGQLGVFPKGAEVVKLLRKSYKEGVTIANATFDLVNELFSAYGLLVLVADDARFKSVYKNVMRNDLLLHDAERLVKQTNSYLEKTYKVQVHPREINLFYFTEGSRERIIKTNDHYHIDNSSIVFTEEEILHELDQHPERFSPNVVLRAMYQEMILPDIAFVGGGAEIAYWLELKAMFDHFKVPFPMLVLRNSFLLYSAEIEQKLKAMGIQVEELFLSEYELMNRYLEVHSDKSLDTNDEQGMANELFHGLKQKAGIIDQSLIQHLDALQTQLHKKLQEASKKMLRAEKRKYEVQKGQLLKIKAQLFPAGSLQERRENILPFYAQYGPACIDAIYQHSTSFWQQFILLSIED